MLSLFLYEMPFIVATMTLLTAIRQLVINRRDIFNKVGNLSLFVGFVGIVFVVLWAFQFGAICSDQESVMDFIKNNFWNGIHYLVLLIMYVSIVFTDAFFVATYRI